jgi:cytochrome c oxidase subunit III
MVLAGGNAGGRLVREKVVADVSELPDHGLGTASLTWWGTLGFILIEGTGFALAVATYFYLQSVAPAWPLAAPPPGLVAGSIMTAVLLGSVVPNVFLSRWAERQDLRLVRLGLLVMSLLGVIPLIIRVFEFASLNVNWDTNAYGSVVWVLLGLHTTHLITDLADTIVLAVLMFTRHGDNARRYGDVTDNSMYWNFVVLAWLPIYACIYWVPRL